MRVMWSFAEYVYMAFKFLFGGLSVGVNKGRKLNSQAHVELCLLYNASCVRIFFHSRSCISAYFRKEALRTLQQAS